MKEEKGITFSHVSEKEAEKYLFKVNNFLRTASYRKNYQKYQKGSNEGKYSKLDSAYLKELSTIDMHFRMAVPEPPDSNHLPTAGMGHLRPTLSTPPTTTTTYTNTNQRTFSPISHF